MNDDHDERMEFAAASEQLHEGFLKITTALRADPGRVRKLTDRTLLALAAWTEGSEAHDVVVAEAARRRAEHVAKAVRFGAFSDPGAVAEANDHRVPETARAESA